MSQATKVLGRRIEVRSGALASPLSDFVTGAVLVADGGESAKL